MDSMVLFAHALREYDVVYPLTFDYGQRHRKEIKIAAEYLREYTAPGLMHQRIVDMKFYSQLAQSALTDLSIDVPKTKDIIGHPQSVTYVPNRNMVMLSIAAGFAESVKAQDVLTAIVALDNLSGYYDCAPEFVGALNNTLALNRLNRIEIKSPLVNMTKAEIIKQGVEWEVDFSQTWTCYKGEEISCGECPSCSGRLAGFIDAKLIDPLPYAKDINWSKFGCKEIA